MTVMPTPAEIRRLVALTFEQFGGGARAPFHLRETLRIDEGKIVARSYRVDGYMAMWLISVGLLQFYDTEGNMLRTVNLFENLRPLKMAA